METAAVQAGADTREHEHQQACQRIVRHVHIVRVTCEEGSGEGSVRKALARCPSGATATTS